MLKYIFIVYVNKELCNNLISSKLGWIIGYTVPTTLRLWRMVRFKISFQLTCLVYASTSRTFLQKELEVSFPCHIYCYRKWTRHLPPPFSVQEANLVSLVNLKTPAATPFMGYFHRSFFTFEGREISHFIYKKVNVFGRWNGVKILNERHV